MRKTPFESIAELDTYIGNPLIECLECGRQFKSLATHLPRTHDMTHDDYREKWSIPKRYPLAGTLTRERLSAQIRDQIDSGRLTYEHLPQASEAARNAGRRHKSEIDARLHSERVTEARPGDHHRLPPGARLADGRDAEWRRVTQQIRRAKEAGDSDSLARAERDLTILRLKREFGPSVREQYQRKTYQFTDDEIAFIKKHYAEHGPGILSAALNRAYGSINALAVRLRLRTNSPQAKSKDFQWDRGMHDPMLIDGHAAGLTMREIAEQIGTSKQTVSAHARRLDLKFRNRRRNYA